MLDGKLVLIICMSFIGFGVIFFRYNVYLVICEIFNCKMKIIVLYSLFSIYVSDIMFKFLIFFLMILFVGF